MSLRSELRVGKVFVLLAGNVLVRVAFATADDAPEGIIGLHWSLQVFDVLATTRRYPVEFAATARWLRQALHFAPVDADTAPYSDRVEPAFRDVAAHRHRRYPKGIGGLLNR